MQCIVFPVSPQKLLHQFQYLQYGSYSLAEHVLFTKQTKFMVYPRHIMHHVISRKYTVFEIALVSCDDFSRWVQACLESEDLLFPPPLFFWSLKWCWCGRDAMWHIESGRHGRGLRYCMSLGWKACVCVLGSHVKRCERIATRSSC